MKNLNTNQSTNLRALHSVALNMGLAPNLSASSDRPVPAPSFLEASEMKVAIRVTAIRKNNKIIYTAHYSDNTSEVIRKSDKGLYELAHHHPTRHKPWTFGNKNSKPQRNCRGHLPIHKGATKIKWIYEDFPGVQTLEINLVEASEMKKQKLSKAQERLMDELREAPLHSSKEHFSWYETYLIDAPYYDAEAIGKIHCYKNKSTLNALEKKGYIVIHRLGDYKSGFTQTDLVTLVEEK